MTQRPLTRSLFSLQLVHRPLGRQVPPPLSGDPQFLGQVMEGVEDGWRLGDAVGLEVRTSQGSPARNRASAAFSATMCSLQVCMSRYRIRLSMLQFMSSSVRAGAMDISVTTDVEQFAWSPTPCSPQKPSVVPTKHVASNSIGRPRDREHWSMALLSSSTNQPHVPTVSDTARMASPPNSPQLYQAVVGEVDGTVVVGAAVGRPVGLLVGPAVVGSWVGPGVGLAVGGSDGEPEGIPDGNVVVGLDDGAAVGGVEGETVVVN